MISSGSKNRKLKRRKRGAKGREIAQGKEKRERERERIGDRDTLISRGCPEGRREASSNS